MSNCTSRKSLNEFTNAPVIVCDNATKDSLNNRFAQQFALSTNQELHYYWAEDYMENAPVEHNSPHADVLNALHSGISNGVLRKLPLVIGMPVMITSNINVESGVVNGSVGTVHSIYFKTSPDGRRILTCCVVHIPRASSQNMTGLADKLYPIMPQSFYFSYTHRNRFTWSVKRSQCPLVPGFAMTAHKSQGQTLSKVIVDLDSCSGSEAPYVMISRVKSLSGLLIYWSFSKKRIRCNISQDSRAEDLRLRILHFETLKKYGSHDDACLATKEIEKLAIKQIATPPPRKSPRREDSDVLLVDAPAGKKLKLTHIH
ncbi:hypothetical protein F5887DRAFT_893920 [Amanita rubescens]|nr:hypothetical protein F5887DRAFT_893920 [Amanita rubescens]